ncbi:hypothetical protein GYMLUDRAFT_60315 [Collybiopsis luxurians FD-317 M1]|uniref:Uncharacterized protein n=1 Tax=Collybiopsis luxurians FD-317 M1 TaxID=944289 RepID=A0A0D0CKT5_9AGAR|nr:hypothetical protein GYMLUDRAFT_60315 [Collybiopsis luxurians FD-317 M1]
MPNHAPFEPIFQDNGLIVPLPNYGRGFRRQIPPDCAPWNYQGEWHGNAAILNGMAFVNKADDYLTTSEALKFAFANCATVHDNEPKSYAQAMSRPPEEAEKWHQAAFNELTALIDHGVFELVQ